MRRWGPTLTRRLAQHRRAAGELGARVVDVAVRFHPRRRAVRRRRRGRSLGAALSRGLRTSRCRRSRRRSDYAFSRFRDDVLPGANLVRALRNVRAGRSCRAQEVRHPSSGGGGSTTPGWMPRRERSMTPRVEIPRDRRAPRCGPGPCHIDISETRRTRWTDNGVLVSRPGFSRASDAARAATCRFANRPERSKRVRWSSTSRSGRLPRAVTGLAGAGGTRLR